MKFIQIMEFEGAPEDAENALQRYIEKADGRSYARKATICAVSYTHLTMPTKLTV